MSINFSVHRKIQSCRSYRQLIVFYLLEHLERRSFSLLLVQTKATLVDPQPSAIQKVRCNLGSY
jgi:hypothetical protein